MLADETRPFLQGARLTAWELVKDGIDTTVITDNMAASMMRLGHVDLVVVGADRIAANGDVANKIGTYGVAVLAKEHGIPFYVAAPLSTVDLNTPDGSGIPIEERNDREVTHVGVVAADARRRAHPESGLRRHAGEVRHARSSPSAASRARRTTSRWPQLVDSCGGLRPLSARPRIDVIVLGIETSCDETAAALVEETGDAARPVATALERRRLAGGDPSRVGRRRAGAVGAAAHPRHLRRRRARAARRRQRRAFDAIAVTQGPGLVGSLLVGVSFAKSLAWARDVPLIPVHHLAGHIESLVLENGEMPLPAVVLVVSGGHTSLYRVRDARLVRAARAHARRCGG